MHTGSYEHHRKVPRLRHLCTMASQIPNIDPHSSSLRRRGSSHCMGTGSKKFRPDTGHNKIQMVCPSPNSNYGSRFMTLIYNRFKLFLEPTALRDSSSVDPRLPRLPVCNYLLFKRHPLNLFLAREASHRRHSRLPFCLMGVCKAANHERDWQCGRFEFVSCSEPQKALSLTCFATDSADVWLTVPAAWNAKGCSIMRSAAITAGLVHASRAGDVNWRDRLRIIT